MYRDDLFEPKNFAAMALTVAILSFVVFGAPWIVERVLYLFCGV